MQFQPPQFYKTNPLATGVSPRPPGAPPEQFSQSGASGLSYYELLQRPSIRFFNERNIIFVTVGTRICPFNATPQSKGACLWPFLLCGNIRNAEHETVGFQWRIQPLCRSLILIPRQWQGRTINLSGRDHMFLDAELRTGCAEL